MSTEFLGYGEFEFDLPEALLRNLVKKLDKIQKAPLNESHVSSVPEEQGVYQLFLDNTLVYIGKTDADAGLNKRLLRHSRKILHRKGLDPQRISFKATRIFVFTAVDLESDLIRHYGGVSGLPWNGSGFGSNDPGRQRDTTANKSTNYDYQYPIDIDLPIPGLYDPQLGTVEELINRLREKLPYTFRVEGSGVGRRLHEELVGTRIVASFSSEDTSVPTLPVPLTARQMIHRIVGNLPPGWQATKLLGYVILYKENRVYPQSEVIVRS